MIRKALFHISAGLVLLASLSLQAQEDAAFDAGVAAMARGHYATAIRAWLPLAEAGLAQAQNNLGHMYEEGLGVAQNYQTAMDWYRKAAAQDLPQAQHNVGLLYYLGYGVRANAAEGVRWFRKAAEQDLPESEYMLGLAYYQGEGLALDYRQAREWFRKSALKAYPEGVLMLSLVLLSGEGAVDNAPAPYQAYIWARLAMQLGQEQGDDVRAMAVLSLEEAQINEAEALVEVCLSQGLDSCPA
jgi:TPR repeat protein